MMVSFAQKNELELVEGWKVELSKMVKANLQKSNIKIKDDVEEMWESLFNNFFDI